MSRYRKITVAMWGDARFRALSAPQHNARYLWIYLLTGPHTGPIPGLSVAGEAALAEALGWPLPKFRQAFAEIAAQGMAEADWPARVLFLPKAIKHNPPESPNVVRSWRTYMAEVAECSLKAKAEAMLKGWLEAKGKAWLEAFGEAFPIAFPEALGLSGAGAGAGEKQEQEPIPLTPQGGNGDGAHAQVVVWLEALNEIGGLHFKATANQLRPIQARIAEGFTLEQARHVVKAKVSEWSRTDMAKYLRPSTLFGVKFDGYLQAATNGSDKATPSRHVDAWGEREPVQTPADDPRGAT
ncbi:MAG: conserved phage C-terminal domain-containing protein [Candidatus Rokubacteria bacterium]|nr:conserved phage C-terminal domain-containing protein [Candidatus Rokubacteria bacterium]